MLEFLTVGLHGSAIEKQILDFAEEQWGEKTLEDLAIKGAEEMGEVCGAALKIQEGRATVEDLIAELADVQVVICQFAAKLGITSAILRNVGFAKIQARARENAGKQPLKAKNGPSGTLPGLQTLQTPPHEKLSPRERRKRNKAAQTNLPL